MTNFNFNKQVPLLLLTCLAVAGCDDDTLEPDRPDAFEQGDDEHVYVSANVPFDPEAVDEATRAVSKSIVAVKSANGDAIPAGVAEEIEDMRLRFGHALVVAKGAPYFASRSADEQRIEITYLGKGQLAPADHDFEASFRTEAPTRAELTEYEPSAKYRGDDIWVTGFNPVTRSLFEVRIPERLSQIVGADADARGANRETVNPLRPAEDIQPRHQVGSADTRVRKGAIDTAHTSTNLSRIVRVGYGCSGVLIGKNQVLTDAHCLYDEDGWNSSTRIRVGANGSGNHGDVTVGEGLDDGASATWTADDGIYWISSLYKDAIDNGGNTIAYDIGTIVMPNDPVGAATGWFGIATPSNSSHDDMLNRGYPKCGLAESPPECSDEDNWYHMFGDTNQCRSGGFSNMRKDPYGYSKYGYHSCDASKGQSGSPLYRDEPSKGWVVRGVHVGKHRWGHDPEELEALPNSEPALSVTLITLSRKNQFDFYNSMYTSP